MAQSNRNSSGNRHRRVTAEELMMRLEADPVWVAERDEREGRHEELVAQNRADAKPVLLALAAAGHPVGSIAELV